jgi:predicted Fe-S protein YdhL (DUF1289 family)
MNSAITRIPVRSLCVPVCEMDTAIQLCKGRFRTQDERDGWPAYTDEQQREVLSRCDQRRVAVMGGVGEIPPCMGPVVSRRRR